MVQYMKIKTSAKFIIRAIKLPRATVGKKVRRQEGPVLIVLRICAV